MCHDFTSGPLTFVEFEPVVPGREQNRGDSPGLPVPAEGGHIDGREVDGEPHGARAHLLVALPCSIAARSEPATCTGGLVANMPAAAAFWWFFGSAEVRWPESQKRWMWWCCGCGYADMGERERLRSELAGGHGDGASSRASTEQRRSERG